MSLAITAIVNWLVGLLKALLETWKLDELKKEADKAKETASEKLADERITYDQFMRDASDYWESTSPDPDSKLSANLPGPASPVPESTGATAGDDRRSGGPKRKTGSRNKRTRQAAGRSKKRSIARNKK